MLLIRRTHLAIVYQGRAFIENTLFYRILNNDLYPDENPAGNTTKPVMIEIQMSKSVRQEFLLAIDFLNNKRQCQLTFGCQTVQPQLTYQTRTSDRKQIIEIA